SRGGTARFLDYEAASPVELADLDGVARQPWLAQAKRTAAAWATNVELPAWHAAVNTRRREQVDRARELVTDRLKQEIAYWQELAARAEQGDMDQRTSTSRSWGEINRLQSALDRRLAELEAQEYIRAIPPLVLAVAMVVPQGLLEELAGRKPKDTYEVEMRAMYAVRAAELALGRTPEAMNPNNPGFDITSTDPATGELFFIEVKGRVAGAEEFFVTNQEILLAQNVGAQHRLALVTVSPDGPAHDTVRYVSNAFDDVKVTTLIRGIQFRWAKTWAVGRQPY